MIQSFGLGMFNFYYIDSLGNTIVLKNHLSEWVKKCVLK